MIALVIAAQASGSKIHVSLSDANGQSTMEQVAYVSTLRIGAKPKPLKTKDASKSKSEKKKPVQVEAVVPVGA